MNQPVQSRLAKRLKHKVLEEFGAISQLELAKSISVNQSTISRLYAGKIKKVPNRTARALANFLGIGPDAVQDELRQFDKTTDSYELTEFNLRDYLYDLTDDLPYQVYLKDTERRFVWVNKAMLAACNYSKLDSLKGLRDEDLFDSPHREEATADDEIVLRGKSIVDKVEFETWKPGVNPVTTSASRKPERLRLVVTTKKPISRHGQVIGLMGFTQPYEITLPEFLKQAGNPWSFSSFNAGIFYQNYRTGHIWCDEIFASNFPGKKLMRWRRVCRSDGPRLRRFFRLLLADPPPGFTEVPATIDFRATVRGKVQWFRGTGIAFGRTPEKTILCGLQSITEDLASESLAAGALSSLPHNTFVFIVDERGRHCFVNQTFADALNIQRSQAIGKTLKEIGIEQTIASPMITQFPTPSSSNCSLPMLDYEELTTRNAGKLKLMSLRMQIDSKFFPVWSALAETVTPKADVPSSGHHVLGIAWDISTVDRLFFDHLAHSAWGRLLNSEDDLIYVKTADGNYRFVNETFLRQTKRTRDEVLGRRAADVFHEDPKLVSDIRDEDEELLTLGRDITQVIRKLRTVEGSVWYQLSTKIAIKNRDGKAEYIIGICRNVSDQVSAMLRSDQSIRGECKTP